MWKRKFIECIFLGLTQSNRPTTVGLIIPRKVQTSVYLARSTDLSVSREVAYQLLQFQPSSVFPPFIFLKNSWIKSYGKQMVGQALSEDVITR